jgi:hypothetical protein
MQSTDQTAPGLAETVAEATAALAAAQALSDRRQAEARTFIVTNGHATVAGHPPLVAGQDSRGRDAGPA